MNCEYCKSQTRSKHLACSVHYFHIECLLLNLYSFFNEVDCIDCRDEFCKFSRNQVCLLCTSTLEEIRPNACKMSKYLCENHISRYMKKDFCKDCFACQTPINKNKIDNCENIEKLSTFDRSIEKQQEKIHNQEEKIENKEEKIHNQEEKIENQEEKIENQDIINSFYSKQSLMFESESINFNIDASSNSSIPKCCKCNSNALIANFCNHNYCEKCLKKLIRKEFQEFFGFFNQKNIAGIKNKFAFKCKVRGCDEIFKIPFSIAERFLGDEIRDFKEFAIYFEGGNTEFQICSQCKKLFGKCGGIKFGCDCR